ncbi:MAG TPA: peptide chain release factor N(5)-glutamine methyltransferase [Vicinamibacteria bacterium]
MTITQALAGAAEMLRAAGVPSPEADAERLLRHALGWDRARLLAEGRASLPAPEAGAFEALLAERARRRPLQHLVGTQAFWKHDFLVTPDVLIPRPETELIVEEALRALAGRDRPLLVDVGTGSGCIALSLAAELPGAVVHAVDLSAAALAVARSNARRLGLEGRVHFHEGDLLDPVLAARPAEACIDLVVSNPPYVDPADRPSLAPEVRDHEPALALFPPGPDVYRLYERLAAQAFGSLSEDGALIVEVGMGMEPEVRRRVGRAGFQAIEGRRDLQGIPRILIARRA